MALVARSTLSQEPQDLHQLEVDAAIEAIRPAATSTRGWNVSPLWGTVTVLSILALWFLAPSGLWLMAFIGIIVLTHEAGHLVAARLSGMKPTEFYWGFGPEVFGFDHNGCRYGVKALFLGGYVKLWGMTPTSVLPEGVSEMGTYRAASHRGRLATILAGPMVNIVMAVLAFALAAWIDGASMIQSLSIGVDQLWFVITGTIEALWLWASNLGTYAGFVFDSSAPEAPVRFLSPVSQASVTGDAVALGAAQSLRWFAILSAAIGAVNLVPLPPLDGSHALMAASERVAQGIKRDRSIRFNVARLEPLAYVTVFVLVALSVSALVIDLRELGLG